MAGEDRFVEHVGGAVLRLVLALLDLLEDHLALALDVLGVEAGAQQHLAEHADGQLGVRLPDGGGDFDHLAAGRDRQLAAAPGDGSDQGVARRPALGPEQQRAFEEAGGAGGRSGLVAAPARTATSIARTWLPGRSRVTMVTPLGSTELMMGLAAPTSRGATRPRRSPRGRSLQRVDLDAPARSLGPVGHGGV